MHALFESATRREDRYKMNAKLSTTWNHYGYYYHLVGAELYDDADSMKYDSTQIAYRLGWNMHNRIHSYTNIQEQLLVFTSIHTHTHTNTSANDQFGTR